MTRASIPTKEDVDDLSAVQNVLAIVIAVASPN